MNRMFSDKNAIVSMINDMPPKSLVFVPPDMWGDPVERKVPGFEHLSVQHSLEPDGFVLTLTCVCGGRSEHLTDMRHMINMKVMLNRPQGPTPVQEAASSTFLDTRNARVLPPFIALHKDCDTTPIKHELTPVMLEAVRSIVSEADETLRNKGQVRTFLVVHGKDNRQLAMTFYDDREGFTDRTMETSYKKWFMREVFRASKQPMEVAYVFSEVWMAKRSTKEESRNLAPSDDPEREEGVMITIVTPTFAALGTARIEREADGSGFIREMSFLYGQAQSRVIDGLMATTDQALSDEAVRFIEETASEAMRQMR